MGSLLTKYEFRKRFTVEERERIDAFNASFEANSSIPDQHKAKLRTGLKDYEASTGIELTDPATISMVSFYEVLGLIDVGRADQILLSGTAAQEGQSELIFLQADQVCAGDPAYRVVREGLNPAHALVEVKNELGEVFALSAKMISSGDVA